MFEIKVTLNASPEFLTALNLLTQAVTGRVALPYENLPAKIATEEPPKPEPDKAPVKKTRTAATATTTPAESATEPAPATAAPTTPAKITFEDVRAEVSKLSTAGKREEVKALLTEFECTRVPDLPETRFAEFIERLQAI